MSFPEQDRAVQILEKEFGPRWKQIVQELGTKELRQRVGKELTSFMAFPERGSGGNNKWRGNCSPEPANPMCNMATLSKKTSSAATSPATP